MDNKLLELRTRIREFRFVGRRVIGLKALEKMIDDLLEKDPPRSHLHIVEKKDFSPRAK